MPLLDSDLADPLDYPREPAQPSLRDRAFAWAVLLALPLTCVAIGYLIRWATEG